MRIWHGYGSDHSANLVMIGEFRTLEDAQKVHELIETLTTTASSDVAEGVIDYWVLNEQFSDQTEEQLRGLKLHSLSPADIADFAHLNASIKQEGNKLHFRTDDVDIGGFVKLMVSRGGKVQVYSADSYPEG